MAIHVQPHKASPVRRVDESGMYNQADEPLFRMEIREDLRTVTVERSDHIGEPYACWKGSGRDRAFRIDPLTLQQLSELRDAMSAAITVAGHR